MAGIESLLVGRTLGGRYRIEEVIGRGGMGAVYRAVDDRLGRQVAVKVITVGEGGEAEARERLRARFFREARSAAALPHHPNVVPVYDYGSDATLGLDYIVMELLRGSDLATRLSRTGPPALAASLKILLEAARGVAVGHRQGLIHRDIKPGNIFLTEPHKNEVQVRVVDFGIAKLADEDDTLAQLTQDGRVPHSPAYASPEQLRGLSQLTPASDVFSLGAVGYQLLTGKRPFTEDDRNRMSLGMPAEPAPMRGENPAIPGSVEQVIRKALAFDAQARFRDAGEMGQALETAMRNMGDLPVEPYLAGAAIVTATGAEEGRPAAAPADDDRTRLMGIEEDADDRTLLAPPPTHAPPPPRQPAPARPLPPRPAPKPQRRSIGGTIVWALVVLTLTAAGIWLFSELNGGRDSAMEIPPPPDSLAAVTPEEPLEQDPEPTVLDAYINNQEGSRYYRAGQFDSALVQFERAVQIAPLDPDFRRNYALTLLRLGEPERAQAQLARAIELAPDRPEPYETLAQARVAAGDTTAAISALEEYLERENRPVQRGAAERRLRDLRTAQQNAQLPPLLGERIPPEPPPPDTLSVPETPTVPPAQ